jgi:hypothetical protein
MQGSGGQLGVPLIASAGAASLPGAEDFRRRTSATRSESSRRSRCRELASDIADGAASAFATCHWPLVSNAHFRPCARGSPGFKARDRRGRFAESRKSAATAPSEKICSRPGTARRKRREGPRRLARGRTCCGRHSRRLCASCVRVMRRELVPERRFPRSFSSRDCACGTTLSLQSSGRSRSEASGSRKRRGRQLEQVQV